MKIGLSAAFVVGSCLGVLSASSQTTIHVPADKSTIQAAIDASSSGDTVVVAPGTYLENVDFHGHNVSLTSSGGSAVTIIDGGRNVSTVKFVTGETRAASISGFTIRNGQPTNLQIGGGIYISGSSPTIRGNVLVDNYCSGIASQQGGPLIQKNTISATHQYATCTYPGTAITLYGSSTNGTTALVDGNTLFSNTEETYGALLINNSEDNVIQNNIIRNNAASGAGACSAGTCILNTSVATLVGNEFLNNTTVSQESRSLYAGILLLSPQTNYGAFQLQLLNNTFVDTAGASTSAPEVNLSGINARTLFLNNVISTQANGLVCTSSGSSSDGAPVIGYNTVSSSQQAYAAACGADTAHANIDGDPGLSLDSSNNYVPVHATDTGNNSALPLPQTDTENDPRIQASTSAAVIDRGAFEVSGVLSPVSRLIIAPSRFKTGTGQQLVVHAALSDGDLSNTASSAIDLYLDGSVVAQGTIGAPGVYDFSPVTLAAGAHEIYAVTHAAGSLPAAESIHLRVLGSTDPSTAAGGSLVLSTSATNPTVGTSVTLTVSMAGQTTPETGTLRVFDNGILLQASTLNTANTFVYALPHTAGVHLFTANYQGSFASSAVQSVAYLPAAGSNAFTVTASPASSNYGQAVTLSASFTPFDNTFSNTRLQLSEGSTIFLDTPLDVTGSAQVTTTTLSPGLHTIQGSLTYTVTDSSSGIVLPGTSSIFKTVQQTVSAATSSLTLSAAPASAIVGGAVTLKATLTSPYTGASASGSITFRDGSTVLGTGALSGNMATLSVSSLALGTHSITASYDGDANFTASTSAVVSVTINMPPDFQLGSSSSGLSLSVQTQHSGSTTLTLTSANGFDGAVQLSCSGLPSYAACSFDASSYTVHAANSVPVSVTVTTKSGAVSQNRTDARPWNTAARLLAVLLPLPLLFRRRHVRLALLLLMASTTLAITGCSGGSSSQSSTSSTPPGTYTITLNATGTSGSTTVTHAVPFVVTVTP